jgi:hypothetical protein
VHFSGSRQTGAGELLASCTTGRCASGAARALLAWVGLACSWIARVRAAERACIDADAGRVFLQRSVGVYAAGAWARRSSRSWCVGVPGCRSRTSTDQLAAGVGGAGAASRRAISVDARRLRTGNARLAFGVDALGALLKDVRCVDTMAWYCNGAEGCIFLLRCRWRPRCEVRARLGAGGHGSDRGLRCLDAR